MEECTVGTRAQRPRGDGEESSRVIMKASRSIEDHVRVQCKSTSDYL